MCMCLSRNVRGETVALAIAIWLLLRSAINFATAYAITKKANRHIDD